MTRTQAEKQAEKRWGRKAMTRAYNEISSPEKRADAKRKIEEARARRDAINAEIKTRLEALDWYQELQREKATLNETLRHNGYASYYKFSVGKNLGFAFEVVGHGDTWEEAFANADERDKRSRTVNGTTVTEIQVDTSKTNEQLERES